MRPRCMSNTRRQKVVVPGAGGREQDSTESRTADKHIENRNITTKVQRHAAKRQRPRAATYNAE